MNTPPLLDPTCPFFTESPVVPVLGQNPVRSANRRFQVLHLINGEHYSGAERVQDLLAARLPELGYDIAFACLKPGKFAEMRMATDAALFETPMSSAGDLRVISRLGRLVRELHIDILHAHTPRTVMIGGWLASRHRLPLVYHVHSPTIRDSTRWLRNRINHGVERWSLRSVDHLITVSESLRTQTVQSGIDPDRVTVVPNGVPASASRRNRNACSTEWTLGSVALYRPRKGMEVLLRALAKLRQAGQAVRLRAVGPFETKEYGDQLLQLTERLHLKEAVDWTGFTRDVDAELAQMDLFVLPSLFGEGLPMVVLEAMSAGVPVVATKVEGTPEAVRDGVDGVLAEPGDVDDLAIAIRRFIEHDYDWDLFSNNALHRHRQRFSDGAMAAGVAQVYQQLVPSNA